MVNNGWPGILRLVAHQLRMPTSLIAGYLEMLESDEIQGDRERRHAILAQVRESVRELNRLAIELQEASRTSTGALPIRKERILVESLIAETVQAAVPLCQYRRVDLTSSSPAGAERDLVVGDRYYLKMCLLNLIDNAAKYGKTGGQVKVVSESSGPFVEVRVVDEGTGLGANASALFAPFVRGPEVLGVNEGIGLGLSLVKAIVEAHEGAMTWTSGGPSYVGFRIPLSAD